MRRRRKRHLTRLFHISHADIHASTARRYRQMYLFDGWVWRAGPVLN